MSRPQTSARETLVREELAHGAARARGATMSTLLYRSRAVALPTEYELEQLVSEAVIPRLLRAHARPTRAAASAAIRAQSEAAASELARRVLGDDVEAAWQLIEDARRLGQGVESIYVDLVEPAARRLGDLWSDDQCNEFDTTLGMGRLQLASHRLGEAWTPARAPFEGPHTVLVAPQPGEPHGLGAAVASEFFRHVGWDVHSEFPGSERALSALVHERWFDALDLSLSGAFRREHRLDLMAATIRAVRFASRNPALVVIVGGRVFVDRPEAGLQIGADASSSTAGESVAKIVHAMSSRQSTGERRWH